MANLPQKHPHLGLHLTDRALTPLITSARSPTPGRDRDQEQETSQLEALTTLSRAALSAHEAASRLGLGAPLRVAVEHRDAGPVVLQSFMGSSIGPHPHSHSRHHPQTSSASPRSSSPNSSPRPASSSRRPGAGRGRRGGGGPNGDVGAIGPGEAGGGGGDGTSSDDTPTSATVALDGNGDNGDAFNDDNDDDRDEEQRTHETLHNTTARLRQVQIGDHHPHGSGPDQSYEGRDGAGDEDGPDAPPMLVGVVVAPAADEALGARRAAARLERVGREVQARWAGAEAEAR